MGFAIRCRCEITFKYCLNFLGPRHLRILGLTEASAKTVSVQRNQLHSIASRV